MAANYHEHGRRHRAQTEASAYLMLGAMALIGIWPLTRLVWPLQQRQPPHSARRWELHQAHSFLNLSRSSSKGGKNATLGA